MREPRRHHRVRFDLAGAAATAPGRTTSDSNAAMASATAASWAAAILSDISGSASAQATLTDLGAENVKSNPVTRPARPTFGTRAVSSRGSFPAITALKSPGLTAPSNPRRPAAEPNQ